MKPDLIPVTARTVGQASVPTVDARALHMFLEVQTQFKDWIARRIEEYGFEDGRDFCSFLSESSGGRPANEYALCLDMAKELSMVERNAKGKQARQYFIECERRTIGQGKSIFSPSRQASEAAKVFSTAFRVARLIGCDKNAAAISANQYARKHVHIDLLADLGQSHLLAANQQSLFFTPTELGQRLGNQSARAVNLILAECGLQSKESGQWLPTDKGLPYARILDTGKKHSAGAPVQQVKWSADVLPLIRIAETRDKEVAQ